MNNRYFYPQKLSKSPYQPIMEEKNQKSYKRVVKMKAALTMKANESPLISFESPFTVFKKLLGHITRIFGSKSNQEQQNVFLNQDASRFAKSAKNFLSESKENNQRKESHKRFINNYTNYIQKENTNSKYSSKTKHSGSSFASLNPFKKTTGLLGLKPFRYLVKPLFALKSRFIENTGSVKSNSIKSSLGAYAFFFVILALFPVLYVDEQNNQSLFLNWVQAKEPAISRGLYPNVSIATAQTTGLNLDDNTIDSSLGTRGLDLSTGSTGAINQNYPDVVVVSPESTKFLEPAKIMGKANFSSPGYLWGGNQVQSTSFGPGGPSGGSSFPIEVVIDPSRVAKSLGGQGDNLNIVNSEYSNETISEENIGDWVDENDQDLFATPVEKKPFTKIDKVKQAFSFKEYTVKSGDSLWVIAKRFSISIDSLLSLNKITNPQGLVLGSKLKIPQLSGIYYEVRKNDSLSKIAGKFNVKINRIDEYNNLDKYIKKGELIFIPGGQYSRFQKDYIFGNLFITPVSGVISSKYGFRIHPIKNKRLFHTGIDIAKNSGKKIRTAADGVIVKAGVNGNYGNYILIKHKMGYETAYAHLSAIWVKPGQKVKKGQFIGRVGNTGLSTGPHLHFEVKQGGKFINPLRFVKY